MTNIRCGNTRAADESGSIILIVVLLLALMSIAGMMAVNMAVTESQLVRNVFIYNQNQEMAEEAASEGVQWILNQTDPSVLSPGGATPWIQSDLTFNENPSTLVLTDANSLVPTSVGPGANFAGIFNQRKNDINAYLRYYFVGWQTAPLSSMKATGPRWQIGQMVGVYKSTDYGTARVRMGVRTMF